MSYTIEEVVGSLVEGGGSVLWGCDEDRDTGRSTEAGGGDGGGG